MNRLPTIPRISMMFAAAALLAACTPAAAEDDGETTSETGETGDPPDIDACIDPGTELLPEIRPVILPTPQSGVTYTCTTGWGTDAPQLAAEWTVRVGQETADYNYVSPVVAAHPDGGVIVAGFGEFAHYGADGEPLWSNPAFNSGQFSLAVEEAGTILLGAYNSMNQDTSLNRYDQDGTLVGEVVIPWNGPEPYLWGVTTFGTDIVIGANDQDEQGFYESALIRLDVDGNVVLRKSTNLPFGIGLAVTDDGVALFGGFLVALDNGEVLGMLTPTNGGIASTIGVGNEFIMAGVVSNATADLGIGRYSSAGGEQWLQSYDRATLGDFGQAVAAGGDGNFVIVGDTSRLDSFSTQPVVFGVDVDGNALWTDRIAAQARPLGVTVDVDGDVYVVGIGDAGIGLNPDQQLPVVAWLRRYAP